MHSIARGLGVAQGQSWWSSVEARTEEGSRGGHQEVRWPLLQHFSSTPSGSRVRCSSKDWTPREAQESASMSSDSGCNCCTGSHQNLWQAWPFLPQMLTRSGAPCVARHGGVGARSPKAPRHSGISGGRIFERRMRCSRAVCKKEASLPLEAPPLGHSLHRISEAALLIGPPLSDISWQPPRSLNEGTAMS